jgi:hypothetical protein
VSGRVTDADGRPIPGAEVVAADSVTGQVKRATTDGEGAFLFRFDDGTAVVALAGQGSTRSFSQVAPPPEDIGGIEVYRPFTMPAQFGGFGARCGAVVIWTKGG